MKSVIILFFLTFLCFSKCNSITQPNAIATVGILGDLTFSNNYPSALFYLQKAANYLQQRGISNSIFMGDAVESLNGNMIGEFNSVNSIISNAGVRWFPTAGDHDVNSEYTQNSKNHTNEEIYRNLMLSIGTPLVAGKLYGSFDLEGYHFINLYSFDHLGIDPRFGNIFYSEIEDEQYNWLLQDLKTNGNKVTIVYTHQPMWYMTSNWQRIHEALAKYNVILVLAGHFHYTQVDQILDGIRYVVIGVTGGTTKNGNVNVGDVRLVGVLSLVGKKFGIQLVNLDDGTTLDPPSKRAMDRVQAQNVINGNIQFGFSVPSTLYYSSATNTISTTCGGPNVNFNMIAGNAIDIPVVYNMQFLSNPPGFITTSTSTFVPNQWLEIINSTGAVIEDGKNADISNFSSVDLVSFYEPMVNMWTGIPQVVQPFSGSIQLVLQFSTSFTFEGKFFYLYNNVTRTVNNCNANFSYF